MLKNFLVQRTSLTSPIIASFSKKFKGPYFYKEPCYYRPLPQSIPRNQFKNIEGETEQRFDRFNLDPHAYWITQGKGTERPFTGKYWDTKDLGHYECVVCSNQLFSSDHKFFPPTGIASFWNTMPGAVELLDDVEDVKTDNTNLTTKLYHNEQKNKRCVCSKCKSHIGTLHQDGPPPTFQRFSINSAALEFYEKPWFHPPQYYRKLRRRERGQAEAIAKKERRKKAEADPNRIVYEFKIPKMREVEESAKLASSNPVANTKEGEEATKRLRK